VLTFIALAAAAIVPQSNDACAAMIPPRLAAIVIAANPDYALPSLADAKPDRLSAIADRGDWPCPFVAAADFDGDGNLDRALVLRHKNQPGVRIVAARNIDGMWRIEVQKDWPIPMASVVVEPLEAGLYEQKRSGRPPAAELDNLVSIQSDHAGFLAGQDDDGKQAFFFVNNAWQTISVDD
jgi:hypothetical protein